MAAYRTAPNGASQTLTPEIVKAWLGDLRLRGDADSVELLPKFLNTSNKTWAHDEAQAFRSAFNSYVDQITLLRAVNDVCNDIIKQFPPQQFLYVGMGRSAAPFIAGLANLRCATVSVPLSSFRPASATASITDLVLHEGPTAQRRITDDELQRVFRHFDTRFQGAPRRPKVLMIDYTQGGQAVVAGQQVLQAYMNNRPARSLTGSPVPVHAFAICRNGDSPTIEGIGRMLATPRSTLGNPFSSDYWISTRDRQEFGKRWHVYSLGEFLKPITHREELLANALNKETFEPVAPYGSYKILTDQITFSDFVADFGEESGFAALREALANA